MHIIIVILRQFNTSRSIALTRRERHADEALINDKSQYWALAQTSI